MWQNGFCRQRGLWAGTPVVKEVNPVTKLRFALDIQVLGKLILGRCDDSQGEGKWAGSDKPERQLIGYRELVWLGWKTKSAAPGLA